MISKIILYLIAIGFGLFFALYMSAFVGWTFVYILVLSPLFSLAVTLFLRYTDKVTVKTDVDRTMLYKGEKTSLRIIAENKSIYPVPAIKVRLFDPKGLRSSESYTSCMLSIPPRSKTEVRIEYTAKVWGVALIGAEAAFLHDYMGFFRFALPCPECAQEIKVFPDVPEIPADSQLLRSSAERVKFFDDAEETKESDRPFTFGGMPGYTHREFVEGDPVRRINWKLSSKVSKYMVRLDDEIETVQQTIILDTKGGNDVYENERAVEGMLAAALGLLKSGFESKVYCKFNNEFECFEMTEPGDVYALQVRLADYRFTAVSSAGKKNERIPFSILSESGGIGIMLYTSFFDKELENIISAAESSGIFTVAVSSDSVSMGDAFQVWRLNEDHSADLVIQH